MIIWAYISALTDPFHFYDAQAPNHPHRLTGLHAASARPILPDRIANVYLLLAVVAVICCFTTTRSVTKWYLIAVGLADFGHIYATYRGIGPEYFSDVTRWNDMFGAIVWPFAGCGCGVQDTEQECLMINVCCLLTRV